MITKRQPKENPTTSPSDIATMGEGQPPVGGGGVGVGGVSVVVEFNSSSARVVDGGVVSSVVEELAVWVVVVVGLVHRNALNASHAQVSASM